MILVAFAAMLSESTVRSVSVTIVRSIVIRRHAVAAAPPPVAYRERRGPRCIIAADIAGAAVTTPDTVDFSIRGGERVRAHLEAACPALDYYRGFYVAPQPDGRICADRDAIRTRSGGECGIDRFRRLVPAKP